MFTRSLPGDNRPRHAKKLAGLLPAKGAKPELPGCAPDASLCLKTSSKGHLRLRRFDFTLAP